MPWTCVAVYKSDRCTTVRIWRAAKKPNILDMKLLQFLSAYGPESYSILRAPPAGDHSFRRTAGTRHLLREGAARAHAGDAFGNEAVVLLAAAGASKRTCLELLNFLPQLALVGASVRV